MNIGNNLNVNGIISARQATQTGECVVLDENGAIPTNFLPEDYSSQGAIVFSKTLLHSNVIITNVETQEVVYNSSMIQRIAVSNAVYNIQITQFNQTRDYNSQVVDGTIAIELDCHLVTAPSMMISWTIDGESVSERSLYILDGSHTIRTDVGKWSDGSAVYQSASFSIQNDTEITYDYSVVKSFSSSGTITIPVTGTWYISMRSGTGGGGSGSTPNEFIDGYGWAGIGGRGGSATYRTGTIELNAGEQYSITIGKGGDGGEVNMSGESGESTVMGEWATGNGSGGSRASSLTSSSAERARPGRGGYGANAAVYDELSGGSLNVLNGGYGGLGYANVNTGLSIYQLLEEGEGERTTSGGSSESDTYYGYRISSGRGGSSGSITIDSSNGTVTLNGGSGGSGISSGRGGSGGDVIYTQSSNTISYGAPSGGSRGGNGTIEMKVMIK